MACAAPASLAVLAWWAGKGTANATRFPYRERKQLPLAAHPPLCRLDRGALFGVLLEEALDPVRALEVERVAHHAPVRAVAIE